MLFIILLSFILLASGFSASSLSVSDMKILTNSNYTFSLTLSYQVSSTSFLSIVFPPDFQSSSLSSLSCFGVFNLNSQPKCTVSSLEVKITSLYTRTLPSGTVIILKLGSIKNLSIGKTTGSFKVYSYDSTGKEVESLNSGMTATFVPLTLDYLKIETLNQTAGSLSTYIFSTNFLASTGSQSNIQIQVPYWNLNLMTKPEEALEVFQNNLQCLIESNSINLTQNCEYLSGSLMVSLNTSFSGPVKLFVWPGLSPASTQTLFGFNFSVFTAEGGLMSFKNSSVSASEPCLTFPQIQTSNEELGSKSDYSFTLTTCLPFNSKSLIKIVFPTEISPTVSVVQTISGFDKINPSFSVTGQELLISNFFVSYKTHPRLLNFKLVGITNPSVSALSSGISVNMSQNSYISSTSQSFFITFAAANLKVHGIWAGNSTVTASTFLIFNLSADSSIPSGAVVYLKLPAEIQTDSVTIQAVQGLSDQAKTIASTNSIIIQQGFLQPHSAPFAFNLSLIRLPSTTKPTSAFVVKVFKDESLTQTLFQVTSATFKATPGALNACEVVPDVKTTGILTSYSFGCTGGMKKNQELLVEFPEDVRLVVASSVCFGFSGFADQSKCEGNLSGVRIKSLDEIPDVYRFKISNVKNCRSFKPVKFQFSVTSDDGFLVSQAEVWSTMDTASAFSQSVVSSSSPRVSSISTYTFILSPSNLVSSSGYLLITSDLDLSKSLCSAPYSCIFNESLKVLLNSVQDSYTLEISNIKNPDSLKPFTFNISSFDPYKQDSSLLEYSMKTGGSIICSNQVLSSSLIKSESSLSMQLKFEHSPSQLDLLRIEFPASFSSIKFQNVAQTSPVEVSPVLTSIDSIEFILPETAQIYIISVKAFKNLYLVDEGTFNISVVCQNPCSNCSDTASKCTKCVSSVPFLSDGSCYHDCPAGRMDVGNFTCSSCLKNCEKCLNFNSCEKCVQGFYLDGLVCTSSCPSGKFASEGLCQSCISVCKTCESSKDRCTSCDSGMVLYKSTCTASCPGIVSNQLCLDCEDCATCSETVKNCTSCPSNRFLFKSQCYSACPSGSFNYGRSCLECSSDCKTCSGWLNKCTSCHEGSELSGNICISVCQQGFYYKESSCLACSSQCLTCKDSPDFCLTCQNGLSYKGQCLTECPSMVTIQSSSSCIDCLETCETCEDFVSNCKSCKSPLLLFNSTCISACPEGFFNTSNSCSQCPKGCQVCSFSGCQLCQAPLILHQENCLEHCPDGTFLSAEQGQCLNCSAGCVECFSSELCFECLPSYFQLDGFCIEECPESFVVQGRLCSEVVCGKNCTASLLNNSVCDPECDFEECDYDSSDCEPPESKDLKIDEEPFSFTTATLVVSAAAGTISLMTGGSLVMTVSPLTAVLETTGWLAVASALPIRGKGRRLSESFSEASEACFIGILILLCLRLGFNCLALKKYLKFRSDEKHEKWIQTQFKSWVSVSAFSLVFSFKVLSVLACGLLGLSLFSAEFDKPSEFHRFLFIFSVIDLVLFVTPMLCMCIYILSIYPLDTFVFILTADVFIVTVVSITISILMMLIFSRKLKAAKSQSRMVSVAVPTAFEDLDFTSSEGQHTGQEEKLAIIKQFLDNLRNFERLRKVQKIAKCRSLDLSETQGKTDSLNKSVRQDRLNETLDEKSSEIPSILIHSFEESKDSEISLSSIEVQVDDKTNDLFEFSDNNQRKNEKDCENLARPANFEVLEVDPEDFEIVRVKVKDLGKVICLKKSFGDGILVDENGVELHPQPIINIKDLEFIQVRSENPGIGVFRSKTGEIVRILRTFTHAQVVQDRKRSQNYEYSLNSRRELVEKTGVKDGHPLFWKFENPKVQQREDFT